MIIKIFVYISEILDQQIWADLFDVRDVKLRQNEISTLCSIMKDFLLIQEYLHIYQTYEESKYKGYSYKLCHTK